MKKNVMALGGLLLLIMGLQAMGAPSAWAQATDSSGEKLAKPSAAGIWWTGKKESKIEIFERDHKFFGKITWLPPEKAANKDIHNPKEDLRARDLMGLEFMSDFVKKGDNFWGSGQIYDPKTGNTYDCKMTLTDPNTLEVRGFVGISLFGRTEKFERVTDTTAIEKTTDVNAAGTADTKAPPATDKTETK